MARLRPGVSAAQAQAALAGSFYEWGRAAKPSLKPEDGVTFAIWGIRFLTLLLANGQEYFTLHAELDWHVLGVVAVLSLLTGVLFGLALALQATRVDVMRALKQSRTGEALVHGFRRLSLSSILMVSQIAITLLILVAAGLFVRTLSNLGVDSTRVQSGKRADVRVERAPDLTTNCTIALCKYHYESTICSHGSLFC